MVRTTPALEFEVVIMAERTMTVLAEASYGSLSSWETQSRLTSRFGVGPNTLARWGADPESLLRIIE